MRIYSPLNYKKTKINHVLDTSELREAEKVRASQEKALKALQDYTLTHYPESPAKFGELLLRIPELQRTCQVCKNRACAVVPHSRF